MAALALGAVTALVLPELPNDTAPLSVVMPISDDAVSQDTQSKHVKSRDMFVADIKVIKETEKIEAEQAIATRSAMQKLEVADGDDQSEPVLAIVVDDCGFSMDLANRLDARKLKFTWAIIPDLKYSRATADLLDRSGTPYLVHVPMQAQVDKDGLAGQTGHYAIGVGMDNMQVANVLTPLLDAMPRAIGINNHRGSKATDDRVLMGHVMRVLKEREKLFLDSATSSRSTAFKTAADLGIGALKNNTFLDNVADREYVKERFLDAIKMAKTKGSAIAICHLRPETIAFLETIDNGFFKSRGVRAVTLPELLEIRKEYAAK